MSPGSPLRRAHDDAVSAGLTLLRASPRGEDRLLLALADRSGAEVAGQWFGDPDRCHHVAHRTAPNGAPGDVSVHAGRLLVQRHGADRRLPTLGRLVTGGGRLVAHRPERRGVVRSADGRSYVKVAPAARAAPAAETLRVLARTSAATVPAVLDCDPEAGTLTVATLPGRTLHELVRTPGEHGGLLRTGELVGRAVADWHDTPVPPGRAGPHDLAAELAVTERWLALAEEHVGLPPGLRRAVARRCATTYAASPSGDGPVLLHRDLHDKQLLVADPPARHVGLLDLDLLAVGDPALDLANLLVHLELRSRQGLLAPDLCQLLARAVLRGYAPTDAVRARLPVHGRLARTRLAAVYAFRPRGAAAAARLVTDRALLAEVA